MTDMTDEALDWLERFLRGTEEYQEGRAADALAQLRRELTEARQEARYQYDQYMNAKRERDAALAQVEAAEQKNREASAEALCQILDAESQRDAAVKALQEEWELCHWEHCGGHTEGCSSFGGSRECQHPRPAALSEATK